MIENLMIIVLSIVLAGISYWFGYIDGRRAMRRNCVEELHKLRHDDGDGQHHEWYQGIDTAIEIIQKEYYKS